MTTNSCFSIPQNPFWRFVKTNFFVTKNMSLTWRQTHVFRFFKTLCLLNHPRILFDSIFLYWFGYLCFVLVTKHGTVIWLLAQIIHFCASNHKCCVCVCVLEKENIHGGHMNWKSSNLLVTGKEFSKETIHGGHMNEESRNLLRKHSWRTQELSQVIF